MVFPHLLLSFILLLISSVSTNGNEESPAQGIVERYYNRGKNLVRPGNSGEPTVISFAIHLNDVHLSFRNEQLLTLLWVTARYNDSRLAWSSSSYGNVTSISLPVKYLWTPDLTLYNSADGRMAKLFRDPEWPAAISSAGQVTNVLPLNLRSICRPQFDDSGELHEFQNCSLKFGSWVHNKLNIDFVKDSTQEMDLYQMVHRDCYKVTDLKSAISSITYECCPEQYVDITYKMRIQLNKLSKRCENLYQTI